MTRRHQPRPPGTPRLVDLMVSDIAVGAWPADSPCGFRVVDEPGTVVWRANGESVSLFRGTAG